MSNDHEWLNLIEVSGPFLAVPVLRDVFPQGLEALPSGRPQRLRRTYEEWRDAVDMDDLDLPALHTAWIDEVLVSALEMDGEVLRRNSALPDRIAVVMPEHGVTVAPDLAVVNPTQGDDPLLLIHAYEPDADLEATRRFDGLATTPTDRMVSLLRATGCPTGIVTNGERWMLIHAPVGSVASFASWYARLWGQESETLRAFVSLLGVRRFFGPDTEKLTALFERSLKHQGDVTDALGEQVRCAVEVLVQALDRADQDRNRDLLRDVDPRELYEAGLTVMMRLVFLLAAEERGLLLLGDPRYDSFYAISSLRMQLRAESEEILERRRSAWSRLLALFRGVYDGIDHPNLRQPALGGSLFDPDRYPFLEGRKQGTIWRNQPAEPLPIDDRTVLLLMESIQTFEGRTLSYRALDVEQIGHVYEGLLERTVKRVDDVTLELHSGTRAKSPRVTLGEIESARLDGTAMVAELLKERSERSEAAIRNALAEATDDRLAARLLTVCRGDIGLRDRIRRYAALLRTDPWGYPLVHHPGAFVVVLGADRRESGTHYTPKSLTEKIVQETLTLIVYHGPAKGKAPNEWELKSAEELLDLKICDPAMGSGAFLVQACRWLADRLVEAWSATQASGKWIDSEGRILDKGDADGYEPLSHDSEERAILARRLIAERCLYGVDRNRLAVELAKLSLWLTTMAKGRPFGFLDHNLRSGDSLFGICDLAQLIELNMNPKGATQLRLFGRTIRSAVDKALGLRAQLRAIPIRDIHDVEAMAALDIQSRGELALPTRIADAFIGIVLDEERAVERTARIETLAAFADAAASGENSSKDRLRREAYRDLAKDAPDGASRRPFHWPLEFPEVLSENRRGFDAFLFNPPFLGGTKIGGANGPSYLRYIKTNYTSRQNTDLCAYFVQRAQALVNESGNYGFLATTTIAQSDTREASLDLVIENGGRVRFAERNLPWPGAASVRISVLSIERRRSRSHSFLDGISVDTISAFLTADDGIVEKPEKIRVPAPSFKGVMVVGNDLFQVSSEEYKEYALASAMNKEVMRPFLTGADIMRSIESKPSRMIIDFADMDYSEASKYQAPFSHVERKVKPFRETVNRRAHRENWWRYGDVRQGLRAAVAPLNRTLVSGQTVKYLCFVWCPTDWVFDQKCVVIATESDAVFSILGTNLYNTWARKFSATLGETLSFAPSDAYETFPFPRSVQKLEEVGKKFDVTRSDAAKARSVGLTELYNAFHDPECTEPEICDLRDAHQVMEQEVFGSFGWNDLDSSLSFHNATSISESDRVRFTISEATRLEVLRRLAKLNRQRYQEEVDLGLRSGPSKGRARRSRTVSASEPTLNLDDSSHND